MIGAIISAVGSLGSQFLKNDETKIRQKAEIEQKKHEVVLAELNNQARLLNDAQQCNADWEIKAMTTSGRALKWASFTLFALPILFTVIAPFLGDGGNAAVTQMWNNFERVPEAWMRIYYAITGGIWGITALKDIGATPGALLNSLSKLRKPS